MSEFCPCSDHPLPAGPHHRSTLVDDGPTRSSVTRRLLLAGGLAVGVTPFVPRLVGPAGAEDLYDSPDLATKAVRPIMYPIVPVQGTSVNRLRNYGDDRGSHIHAGEDMMAAKLSLLLACVDGTVVRRVFSASGNYLYLKGDDGWIYGYLHINNDTPGTDDAANPSAWAFGPGIVEGATVRRGQLVAYVGDSGNAESVGSHLHFEIRKPNTRWYWAQAVNPAPSLDAADPAVRLPSGAGATNPTTTSTTTTTTTPAPAASPFAPFTTAGAFADRQSRDFLAKAPSAAWTAAAVRQLSGGTTPDAFVAGLVGDPAITRVVNPVIRLYQAYFGGVPSYEGVAYWAGVVRGGTSLDRASAMLASSSKFIDRWGALGDDAFARQIYVNLYGAEPSAKVRAELTSMLALGLARGALVRAMCETEQYRALSAQATRVTAVYHAMLRRAPATIWRDRWAAHDRASRTGLVDLIASIRTGAEYARRFA